jgi:hypothetical protein
VKLSLQQEKRIRLSEFFTMVMEAKPKRAQYVAFFGIVGCGKPDFLTLVKNERTLGILVTCQRFAVSEFLEHGELPCLAEAPSAAGGAAWAGVQAGLRSREPRLSESSA